MGPFDHIQKQGSEAIKPQPANIRREIISTVIKPQKKLIPTPIIRARSKNRRSTHQTINTFNISNSSNLCGQPSKKRPFINSSPLVFDSDDESRKETLDVSRKLLKRKSDHYLDLNRRVRNHEGRISNQTETLQFVHAAEISTVRNSAKYRRAFLSTPEASVVYLQYPSTCAKEKLV